MKRKISLWFPVFLAAGFLSGCQKQQPASPESGTETKEMPLPESVSLTVWGAAEDEALLCQIFDSFQEQYRGEADFQIDRKSTRLNSSHP